MSPWPPCVWLPYRSSPFPPFFSFQSYEVTECVFEAHTVSTHTHFLPLCPSLSPFHHSPTVLLITVLSSMLTSIHPFSIPAFPCIHSAVCHTFFKPVWQLEAPAPLVATFLFFFLSYQYVFSGLFIFMWLHHRRRNSPFNTSSNQFMCFPLENVPTLRKLLRKQSFLSTQACRPALLTPSTWCPSKPSGPSRRNNNNNVNLKKKTKLFPSVRVVVELCACVPVVNVESHEWPEWPWDPQLPAPFPL